MEQEKVEFKYTIGEKVFKQSQLVLGQIQQLQNLIKDVIIPEDVTVSQIIGILGDKLPLAIAIVLREADGKSLKDKDYVALANEISFDMTVDQTVEIIENFFDCNQISSLLKRVQGLGEKISGSVSQEVTKETGLTS